MHASRVGNMSNIKIGLFGDVVGAAGREIFQKHIARLKEEYNLHFVVVNGENSADGRGVTPKIMQFFKQHDVNVVTSGNHIWQKKEIYPYLIENKDLLRPANFPSECPGSGVTIAQTAAGLKIGVLNIQGRIFMREFVSCPFKAADTALSYLRAHTHIILVDFHAEATAEKLAMGYYLDGKVTAVVGTHTHVQTADERILPGGTAYITDLGMAGALNSMIGMKKEPIMHHMITQLPVRFEVDMNPPFFMSGAIVTADTETGKALDIERVYLVDEYI